MLIYYSNVMFYSLTKLTFLKVQQNATLSKKESMFWTSGNE